jgi:hypothetical protein
MSQRNPVSGLRPVNLRAQFVLVAVMLGGALLLAGWYLLSLRG